jgi:hypothetical protein
MAMQGMSGVELIRRAREPTDITYRPTDNLRFASGFWFLIVSDDPERTFAEADHVIYQVNNYSVWLQAGGLQPLAPHLNDQEVLKQPSG